MTDLLPSMIWQTILHQEILALVLSTLGMMLLQRPSTPINAETRPRTGPAIQTVLSY